MNNPVLLPVLLAILTIAGGIVPVKRYAAAKLLPIRPIRSATFTLPRFDPCGPNLIQDFDQIPYRDPNGLFGVRVGEVIFQCGRPDQAPPPKRTRLRDRIVHPIRNRSDNLKALRDETSAF